MQPPPTDRRPRLALVTNGLTRAGAETQLVRLALSLRARGDDVRILSILPPRAFEAELAEAGIPVTTIDLHPRLRALSALARGRQVLRKWQPDAVVSFDYQADILGRIAGRMARVPVVISSIRNERFGGRSRELVVRLTDRLATVTVFNSERAAHRHSETGTVPEGRRVVIPNGLDPQAHDGHDEHRARTRQQLGLAADAFVWACVARLEPQKDHETLLAAFARHQAEVPPARLVLAGDGSRRDRLEGQALGLGIGEFVLFLGPRDDVPVLLAGSDALVLSSRWEGLPNVVLEALAARRPVVATDAGGTAEIVAHEVHGLLVPPGDPEALATAMTRMARLPAAVRAGMGAQGRALVDRCFHLDVVLAAWRQLIDDCLAARPRPGRPATSRTAS